VGVVRALLMMSAIVMLSRFLVMLGSMCVMFRSLLVARATTGHAAALLKPAMNARLFIR
jgi:hypothetical protein